MKRISTFVLILVMVVTCFSAPASANSRNTEASLTLSGYSATLKTGSSRGVININYDVRSSKAATTIGVEYIAIYKEDGSPVMTIYGTTENGLKCSNSNLHAGDYSITLSSGVSYYAVVKIFASVGSETDSRIVTTDTVNAP